MFPESVLLRLAVYSVILRNTFGCHDGGSNALATCPTKNYASVKTCKYCCWDGNSAWAVMAVTGVGDSVCAGNGAGGCMDFSYIYGTTGSTNTPNPSKTGFLPRNTVLTVTCSNPYYRSGPSTVTCSPNSYTGCNDGDGSDPCVTCDFCCIWTTIPSCLLGCGSPIAVANSGSITYSPVVTSNGVYAANTVATVVCSSLHYLVGSSTVTCTSGSWSTLPQCVRGCSTISAAANRGETYSVGTVSAGLYPANTQATFACTAGYYLSTTPVSPNGVCTAGSWGSLPTCIQGCSATFLYNGTVSYSSGLIGSLYPASTVATFTCDTGFYLSTLTATTTRTCTSGAWGALPYCILGCPATTLSNGAITYSSTVTNSVYQASSVATFSCSTGYYLSTLTLSTTRTCTNGAWGSSVSCIRGCSPTSIVDGTVSYNPSLLTNSLYQAAANATFSCNAGFYLSTMNPTEIQTCTNGAWGTAVSCVQGCAARTINNGAIVYNPANTTNNVYQSGADATYTCATGYYLSSLEDVTIQICSGGSWGATLSCIEGCFVQQNVTTGQITYNPNNTINNVYQASTNASISCYTDFYSSGVDMANCSSGNWTSALFCYLGCRPLKLYSNGKISYSPSTVSNLVHPISTVAEFSCEFGYKRRGSARASCFNGSWTDPLPFCQAAPFELLVLLMDISCTFLLVSLGVTFMTFLLLRDFTIETILHMGEELSLFCAHVLILLFKYRVDLEAICTLTAIGLQYFFITAYTFFVLESLQFFCLLQNIISFGGPWEYPRFRLLVIGWVFAFIPTGITAVYKYSFYISTFSCWLNIGNDITFGTCVPVFFAFLLTVVFTEAAAMGNPKALPLTDRPQIMAARFNQKSILIIMSICTAGWFLGLFATYNLTIFLGVTVTSLNIALGVCIWVFHYMGTPTSHKWFNEKIKKRICKNTDRKR